MRLPEEAAAAAETFGLHPALFDSALHAAGALLVGEAGSPVLPFAWSGVSLHATGACALRVRLRKTAPNTVSLAADDETGQPVLRVASLVLRPVRPGRSPPVLAGWTTPCSRSSGSRSRSRPPPAAAGGP